MSSRKDLSREYKERKLLGGVYTITNTENGKYLLAHAANLASARNHFQFAVTTGSAVHPALRKDWKEMGSHAFAFNVLEEVEQRPGQSSAEYLDDLKTLEHLWRAHFDPSLTY